MASRSTLLCAAMVSLLVCPAVLLADKIQIISEPPGASVEVDGKTDITPCEMDFPASYFRDPHTLLSKHLNHPIVARFTHDGYLPKELPLTEGPLEWVSASGHKRYQYWLFRSAHFHVDLDPAGKIRKPSTDNVRPARQALLRQKLSIANLSSANRRPPRNCGRESANYVNIVAVTKDNFVTIKPSEPLRPSAMEPPH
jgi:hypothetical protein